MSYGTWNKRGKGWCSVEIDSPWNGEHMNDLRDRSPAGYGFLNTQLERLDREWSYDDDVVALRFEANHRLKGRIVVRWDFSGGEHITWIAFDDAKAALAAIAKHTDCPIERAKFLRAHVAEEAPIVPELRLCDGLNRIQKDYGSKAKITAINQVFGTIDGKHDWHTVDLGFWRGASLSEALFVLISSLDGKRYDLSCICLKIEGDEKECMLLEKSNWSANAADYHIPLLLAPIIEEDGIENPIVAMCSSGVKGLPPLPTKNAR